MGSSSQVYLVDIYIMAKYMLGLVPLLVLFGAINTISTLRSIQSSNSRTYKS